jgi:predicted dehydrogenase
MNPETTHAPQPASQQPNSGDRGVIRVGIVGGGFMARTHSLAYRAAALLHGDQLPRIEQVRLADIDEQTAKRAADLYGWGEATGDWHEITRAPDIDLVDIVTPNDSHADVAVDAANNGKHVLCEKPLSNTVQGAQRMHAAAQVAGVLTQVGFVFRTWPATALAKQLIEEGRIGEIHQLRAHYLHDYALDPDFSMGWRTDRSVAGAGSIGDLGSHVIDLARYLAGDITAVTARTRTLVPQRPGPGGKRLPVDVDDMADVLVDFDSGATGVIHTNWMAAGHKTDIGFEVSGSQGAISFTWQRPGELLLYDHRDPSNARGFRTIHLGPEHPGAERFWPVAGQGLGYGDAFTVLIARYLAAIKTQQSARPDFEDGLRCAEVLAAIIASANAPIGSMRVELSSAPTRTIGAWPRRA